MLLAVLFGEHDEILAAAPACDQSYYGERYWSEIHAGKIRINAIAETAYVSVKDADLRQRILQVGIDESICGFAIADEIKSLHQRLEMPGRAA